MKEKEECNRKIKDRTYKGIGTKIKNKNERRMGIRKKSSQRPRESAWVRAVLIGGLFWCVCLTSGVKDGGMRGVDDCVKGEEDAEAGANDGAELVAHVEAGAIDAGHGRDLGQ